MLSVLSAVIYASVVLIAILLIVLVLVQPSKGGGFGSAFGGVGESVFGAQAMSQLSKLTVVLLTIFFLLTLTLAVITGHRTSGKSLIKAETVAPAVEKSAVPAAVAPVMEKKPAAANAGTAVSAPVRTMEKKAEAPASK